METLLARMCVLEDKHPVEGHPHAVNAILGSTQPLPLEAALIAWLEHFVQPMIAHSAATARQDNIH